MNFKSILAAVLAATLTATLSITVFAAEPPDHSKEIEAMSLWLDGLTLTPSAGTFTYYPQAGASGDAATAVPSEFTDGDLANYADKVFELVNKERENVGAAPLERSGYLDDAANTRAQDCASVNSLYVNGVPHVRPDCSQWFTVLGIDKNYNYGENVGQGGPTAEIRMASWMKSEGHRANILKEDYTEIGIGCAVSEQGEIFATQIFYRP